MGPGPRVVDVLLAYLKAEGCNVVFGVPGGLLHPFFEAVEQDEELQLIVTKHEEGAAFMADGFARLGRRLAVCAGTAGPGATNLLTGVSVAYADGIPLLVITGQAASHALGKGAAQETPPEYMDTVAMFRPVTKYSVMVTSAAKLAHHLRVALRLALSGRQGPVHLNVPVDFWERPADDDGFTPATYRSSAHLFDRSAVQEAGKLLSGARRPVILAGSGVGSAGAEEHLRALAELLPARVATTPRAKGLFPEDHPLSLGVFGFAGHRAAREALLGDIDALMCVGASLNETTTLNWQPGLNAARSFIQLDIDEGRIGRNYPVDVALVGDAQAVLIELIYQLHRSIRHGSLPKSTWGSASPLPRGEERYDERAERSSDAYPLMPQRWRAELEKVLPRDAIVFSDIGGHMLFNIHHLLIRGEQTFVLNLGFGSMGHGTVAPVGAALVTGRRPVIAIVGDACFTMNGMELLTAAEYRVPVVWLVENNQMHGITWHGSQMVGSRVPMSSVVYKRPIEIAAISRSMGLAAWVVDRPGQLGGVLTEALAQGAPSVIELRVDAMARPPLGDRAQSVAGFTKS